MKAFEPWFLGDMNTLAPHEQRFGLALVPVPQRKSHLGRETL